jgi:hypothetical protein
MSRSHTPGVTSSRVSRSDSDRPSVPSSVKSQARAAENLLIIRNAASLHTWRQQVRTFTRTSSLPTVQLQLPELPSDLNQSMSALANEYQKECGCTSGSFFMSFTVVALIVSYFLSGGHLSGINLTHVISLVVITVFSTLSGKLLGLLWARWRLLKLATNLHATVVRAAQGASV